MTPELTDLALQCRMAVIRARADGVHITRTNALDLCADALPRATLASLRAALPLAGLDALLSVPARSAADLGARRPSAATVYRPAPYAPGSGEIPELDSIPEPEVLPYRSRRAFDAVMFRLALQASKRLELPMRAAYR